MSKTFEQTFGYPPEAMASAPGRVNLLGEHTDYNEGWVLPIATEQSTTVQIAHSRDARSHIYSVNRDERVAVGDELPRGFACYVIGCLRVLGDRGITVPRLAIFIESSVPMGAGLSSSAALEVATLRALRELFDVQLDDVALAQLALKVEHEYVNVRCGIMDPMAASLARSDQMLFLDTRTLATRLLPLPAGTEVIVLDSGVPRTLAGSAYNERRAQCEKAARLLNVPALRDADAMLARRLPSPLNRRALHVISENHRVLEAAGGVDARTFGELMNASHASLRDEFEVSVPALDQLVACLQRHSRVFGARLTGAGFGGASVALVEIGAGKIVSGEVLREYNSKGNKGRALV